MGLFGSSKSSTETDVNQADNRQFASDAANNLQATDDSVATSVASGGIAIVNRSTGGGVNIVYENLNADLAAHAIDQVTENAKSTLRDGLGFADDQITRVFQMARETSTQAANQLEETRDFAADMIDQVSTTADERFQNFSMGSMGVIALLFGVLIWRST